MVRGLVHNWKLAGCGSATRHRPGCANAERAHEGSASANAKCARVSLGPARPQALGVDVAARLRVLRVEEPPKRRGGVRVASVAELVDKLHNEAKVV